MTKTKLLKTAKPILFNTEMVKAILEGSKTATRRTIKMLPENCHEYLGYGDKENTFDFLCGKFMSGMFFDYIESIESKYSEGDILYVRETFAEMPNRILYKVYKENEKFYQNSEEIQVKWRPSIHMPKEAARLFLKVTDVRVERLQDITAEDCIAEGVEIEALNEVGEDFAKGIFSDIWDSTLKKSDLDKYGWDANPWVWVYEFEVIKDGETK